MHKFRKFLISILIPSGLAYGALVGYVYAIQDRLTYYPAAAHAHRPADFGLTAGEHRVPTADGENLHAWYFRQTADPNSRFVLLYAHGNAGNISHNLDSVRQFQRLGLTVFLFDYRGYGKSTGRPDEQGLYRDATAAYVYLRETLGVPAHRIVLFGRSLGGAVALELATRVPNRALILESTFTSAPDLGAGIYWYLPVRLLARSRFASQERLAATDLRDTEGRPLPLLVIHSRQDQLIPFAHGRRLFETARTTRKKFIEIQGGHNDGFLVSRKRYEAALVEFLRSLSAP